MQDTKGFSGNNKLVNALDINNISHENIKVTSESG